MCDPNSLISSSKTLDQLKTTTIGGFKKTNVINKLVEAFGNGNIESACYWSAQLLASGQLEDLWDTITGFAVKKIHHANPFMFPYLELRLESLRNILSAVRGDTLNVRNDKAMRQLIAEIVVKITLSKKGNPIVAVKVDKTDYDLIRLSEKLKAPDLTYITDLMRKDDAQELIVALNEMCYHLSDDSKDSVAAYYWIEWIMQFDNVCRKKKTNCSCAARCIETIDVKHQKDPIWLVWEILIKHAFNCRPPLILKIVRSLFELYKSRYSLAQKKKRRLMLYFVINLITQPLDPVKAADTNKEAVEHTIKNIDAVYVQISKDCGKEQVETKESKPITAEEKRRIKMDALLKVGSTKLL